MAFDDYPASKSFVYTLGLVKELLESYLISFSLAYCFGENLHSKSHFVTLYCERFIQNIP